MSEYSGAGHRVRPRVDEDDVESCPNCQGEITYQPQTMSGGGRLYYYNGACHCGAWRRYEDLSHDPVDVGWYYWPVPWEVRTRSDGRVYHRKREPVSAGTVIVATRHSAFGDDVEVAGVYHVEADLELETQERGHYAGRVLNWEEIREGLRELEARVVWLGDPS